MSKSNKLRRKAQDLLKKGKLDKAIELYKKLLLGQASNPNLSNELGDIYLRAGDRIQAVSSFEIALENYEKIALYNNAVAVCKKILRIAPGRLITIFRLGELKTKQYFLNEAAEYFSKYMELLLSDSNLLVKGTEERIEVILESIEKYPEIVSKAVDVFEALGINSRASQVNAKLIKNNCENVDSETLKFYKERMKRLKSSLSEEECEKIDRVLDSIKVDDSPKADDEMEISDLVSETVVGTEDLLKVSPQHSYSNDGGPGEIESEKFDLGNKETKTDFINRQNNLQSGIDIQKGDEESSSQSPQVIEEPFLPPELDDQDSLNTGGEAESPDFFEEEQGEDQESFEDLSDLTGLDDEDETDFAKQITSDVEKDDFKSHYDLGMAYIEMDLLNDAIKELQISFRSPEFRLRSLEMIGHCFILKKDFHLAVKQLEKGVGIAGKAGDENLGIHYNLGLAYEALDDVEKAREHFEEVYIVDITFRDISEKMKKIKSIA